MSEVVWKHRVDTALVSLQRDRWTAPSVRYLEIVDEVAAGRGSTADIARRAGSPGMVDEALGRVTLALLGDGTPQPLDRGGWFEVDGGRYRVSPGFAEVWIAARDAQRRMEARQSA